MTPSKITTIPAPAPTPAKAAIGGPFWADCTEAGGEEVLIVTSVAVVDVKTLAIVNAPDLAPAPDVLMSGSMDVLRNELADVCNIDSDCGA